MRNFFIFLLITVFCALVIYFLGNSLLQESLETRLKSVPEEMSKLGIEMETPAFKSFNINSTKSLSINDIHTRFSFRNKELYSPEESFNIIIEDSTFEAVDSSYKKLKLTLNNVKIQSIPNERIETSSLEQIDSYEEIKFDFISTDIVSETSNPEKAMRQLFESFAYYIKSEKLNIPIKFQGSVNLKRGDSLRLKLVENFEIEKSSFEKLAGYNLSEDEKNFIAAHPLRAGTILRLIEESVAFTKKTSASGADNETVSKIYYLINIKRKFGTSAELIFASFGNDEKRKAYLETANEFINKNISNEALITQINAQGKNFPQKSKATYRLN